MSTDDGGFFNEGSEALASLVSDVTGSKHQRTFFRGLLRTSVDAEVFKIPGEVFKSQRPRFFSEISWLIS